MECRFVRRSGLSAGHQDGQTPLETSESENAISPVLRVVLISPPLDASGGIGRLMSYVLARLDDHQIAVRHVDPRGRSSRPILSVFPLLRAAVTVIVLKGMRRVDLVHINMSYRGSTIRKGIIVWMCNLMRIPIVLHLHTCEYQEFYQRLPRIIQECVRGVFQRADHILVLGHVWEAFLVDELGISKRNISVLYNAAPGPALLASRHSRMDRKHIRLLFLGQLGARKGVPELLRALSLIPPLPVTWTITMAGDGDIDWARKLAREFGILDRVTFTGWLDSVQVRDILESSDVLILPSHAEGFPMSIVEAFAYGVAVISSPVGSIPEIVVDRENGLLVSASDVDALERAIESLCVDGELREKLALAGHSTWESRLAIANYTMRITQYWFEIAGRRRHSLQP